jgi:hypothetical protein
MSTPVSYVELNTADLVRAILHRRWWFPPFTLGGVGRGAYVTDPTGLLIGLHMYDPAA